MKLYLNSVDGENENYEADVTTCILSNDSINILFQTMDDGEPVQGRLSLQPINQRQSAVGYWIYPDTKKEVARISEKQKESEESKIEAKITGTLYNYKGNKVVFSGTWIDEDGEYELDIDAKIT